MGNTDNNTDKKSSSRREEVNSKTAKEPKITKEVLARRIDVATGRKNAELVLKNAKIVNVFSHEIIEGSLAIDRGVIVGTGAYTGEKEVDMMGRYLIPGLLDAHVHIESSLSTPGQFAKAVVPHGTTGLVADPHEIANVKGKEGVRFMIESSRRIPLKVRYMVPSCVPATEFEHAGAVLDSETIEELMDEESVIGLGEVMDYPSLVNGEEELLDKLMTAHRRGSMIDGHGPMLLGRDLNAYASAGIRSDHESSTLEEMRERLRAGMYCLIRQGSAAQNLPDLIAGVRPENSRRCMFCTDDRHPEDVIAEGHIDNHLRMAVERGIDPITAVQMATINTAEAYGLKTAGALAPGYDADIAVVEDLKDFKVHSVYIDGKKAAEGGTALFSVPEVDISRVTDTVRVKEFGKDQFALSIPSGIARVMRLHPNSLLTEEAVRKVNTDSSGNFIRHPKLDILKIAVIERHKASGNIGLALVENYKLSRGAVASTIAHDSHNIITVGENDEDMYAAVQELIRVGGGITLAEGGEVLDTLPLPVAGLMSDRPIEEISGKLHSMYKTAFERLGVNSLLDPFMTLSFLALPVIPELKLTDMGLFDARSFTFTEVNVAEGGDEDNDA
ncbi:MAG: adenine deaminase [Spirochaetia bacterium]